MADDVRWGILGSAHIAESSFLPGLREAGGGRPVAVASRTLATAQAYAAANGIDRKQWIDTYNSFSIAARANRAGQIWRAYNVDGTPMMGVDGKFTTAPSMVGSREGSLIVLDYLVQQARAEHGKK